jgi:hypothetical protein
VWLTDFVDAFFQDHLLDTPGGACFVLQALAKRPAPAALAPATDAADPPPLADHLQTLARHAFADLLAQKADEALERHASFG